MKQAVYCIAKTEIEAERIVTDLRASGCSLNEVSVLWADQLGTFEFGHSKTQGASVGLVGEGLRHLAGIGSLDIPGVGSFVAGGPIMAALSGAVLGAAVGGLTGALVGMGIPEYEAKHYAAKLRQGHVLISVKTDDADECSDADDVMKRAGGDDIWTSGGKPLKR